MNENINPNNLPDAMLEKALDELPKLLEKIEKLDSDDDSQFESANNYLRDNGMIEEIKSKTFTDSIIAVDGMQILNPTTDRDLLLCTAIGIGGLNEIKENEWPDQYLVYLDVLNHSVANEKLVQGIMHLLELKVLSTSNHEIRIIDGTHFTPIIKLNNMLSAREDSAPQEYVEHLRDFMSQEFESVIPDMPNIIKSSLESPNVIAMPKSISSRDVIDAFLSNLNIKTTDRSLFSKILKPGEYLKPLSVGQSARERDSIWDGLHVICNLNISSIDKEFSDEKLNSDFEDALLPIKTKVGNRRKESNLFYTYFKTKDSNRCFRVEFKKEIANDKEKTEKILNTLNNEILYPDIMEPFPQYLADQMAKSASVVMDAMQAAIATHFSNEDNDINNMLFGYRT